MASIVLLGTGAAATEPHRTTTMLGFAGSVDFVAVDCGGDLVHRMLAAGFNPVSLRALVLTHEHADHVGGFPLFMEKLWLLGRILPIPVYGPASALSQAERCFRTFDTSRWEGLPEIEWHEVAVEDGAEVLRSDDFTITAGAGAHGVPVIGLRVTSNESAAVAAYSSDTEPCDGIREMARGASILVHEATGERPGHTSAEQAAEIARSAEVGRLVLVHIPDDLSQEQMSRAMKRFERTAIGQELDVFPW